MVVNTIKLFLISTNILTVYNSHICIIIKFFEKREYVMVLLLVLLDLHHFQILNVFLNLFLVRVGKELDFQRTIGEINLLVVHTVEIFFKRLTP